MVGVLLLRWGLNLGIERYIDGKIGATKQTDANASVRAKMTALRGYEARYIDHIYTIDLTGAPADLDTLALGHVDEPLMAPLLAVIAFQVLAWRITCANGVDLSHQIFTDFSEVVHNKTEVQDYV